MLYSCMAGLLVLRLSAAPRLAPVAAVAPTAACAVLTHEYVAAAPPEDGPAYCVVGPMLCRVRVWTEAEWEELPEDQRPELAEHVPGMGWFGAVPEVCLN